jgi:enoyl-CoA hydratase/carnithine racemase
MSSLRIEHGGTVAVVTLDRPPANALDAEGLHAVADAFEHLGADTGVEAIVLTGEGRAFSAGLDLKVLESLGADGQDALIDALNRAFLAVYSCPRYVVGAVNGHAIAGGLVLALCCDLRLVADVALSASLAEVRVGVVYPVGPLEVVRSELSPPVLRRMVLSGETLDAARGVDEGVFDRVVPVDELLTTAIDVAQHHPPPLGFARIKSQLRRPALEVMQAAVDGGDPLVRPWLTDETFAAAAATLRR